MRTNLTDTQKFRLGNEIAKQYTGQAPAYGVDHQETKKVRTVKVREPMKKELKELLYVVGWCVVIAVMFAMIWR